MNWKRLCLSLLFVSCAICAPAVDQNTPNWFAWQIPSLEPLHGAIDASELNVGSQSQPTVGSETQPTELPRIEIRDGHFVTPDGERARFFGTNLCFNAVAPPKDIAPKMATHLSQLGFNIVRFHHMDTWPAPRGIMQEDRVHLAPEMIDRMEFLINELEKNGIYVNINLHVGRVYPGTPSSMASPFNMGKILDQFYPPYIQMQKDYARELLTHKNPYTGKTLAEDPGVLVMEITNEDSVFQANNDDFARLPDPYHSTLMEKWRAWLGKQYASDEQLREAWGKGLEEPGQMMLTNADFSNGFTNWTRQNTSSNNYTIELADGVLNAAIGQGTRDDLQLFQMGLTFNNGRQYTFAFDAQSPSSSTLQMNARLDRAPWTVVGINRKVPITPDWQHYELAFTASKAQGANNRIGFNFGHRSNSSWRIRNVSLHEGSAPTAIARTKQATIASADVPANNAGSVEAQDFNVFLFETECATAAEMKDYLKNTLHVGAHIADTQDAYGGLPSVYREATLMDYVDIHDYWQHPNFPNKQWDPADWRIQNTPMSGDPNGGTFARLARYRVAGKPYNVSEYNHPMPSNYALEMFPMLGSFASMQDWDAIYQFTYRSNDRDWDARKYQGFFDLDGNSGQLAFVPFAARAFRQGLFTQGNKAVTLKIPASPLDYLSTHRQWDAEAIWEQLGGTPSFVTQNRVAVDLVNGIKEPSLDLSTDKSMPSPVEWTTGENGVYRAIAPNAVALAGVIAREGETQKAGPFEIKLSPTSNQHACFTAVSLDGKNLSESQRILMAVGNRTENTNMKWSEDRHTVNKNWGDAPVLAEGVAGTIGLRTNQPLQVTALKSNGDVGKAIQAQKNDESADALTFAISPSDQTMWYLLAR